MKKFKILIAAVLMMCSTAAFAGDFDWSKCWCNYGAGIKEGNMLLSVDGGLSIHPDFYLGNGYGFIPTVIVDFEYAKKIWVLPFTFGGYAGFDSSWHKDYYVSSNFYAGGSLTYHVMLPPKSLDVYATTKVGFVINTYNDKTDAGVHGNPFAPHFETNLGASYFFTDSFGVNLEFGYPFQKFGMQFKF